MSDASKTFLARYGEWTWKLVILLGLCANLYLTRSFVTRPEFEGMASSNTADHLGIKVVLVDLTTTLKIMAQNELSIKDHETRMRVVESRQVDVISRVQALERVIDRHIDNPPNKP